MKTLNYTIVFTESNQVTNIEKRKNANVYKDFFTKKVSLFHTENGVNIFIDTIDIVHTNYAEFGNLCLQYVLDYLGKKVTDFDTISPLIVAH